MTPLDFEGRKAELARIIGGASITPTTLHERVPLFIGSRKDVEAINAIYKK